MKTRRLGSSALDVSAIGLGCMGLSHAFGPPTPRDEAIRLIRDAHDLGYTFFDTAECYTGTFPDGTPSNNEELVGEALRPVRDEVVIATKFGVEITDEGLRTDSRPETIRSSVDGSLRRLGVERIDLYYQHRQDPTVPVEDVAGVMGELIDAGKIATWGLSEVDEGTIRRAHAVTPVTAVQNRYSMLARRYEDVFAALDELSIALVAFSPLANGFLTGPQSKGTRFDATTDYRARMPQYSDEGIDRNQQLLDLVTALAADKSATPAQVSLAWMLGKHPWIVPIPGTRSSERLRENAAAADMDLTGEEIARVDAALDALPAPMVFGGSAQSR